MFFISITHREVATVGYTDAETRRVEAIAIPLLSGVAERVAPPSSGHARLRAHRDFNSGGIACA